MTDIVRTPEGTRDLLFAECRDRRRVQDTLTQLFARRGYAEIITPEVEFYDLFLGSGNPLPQEAMLKIIDRSGKIMVMRPDCTTPIARVAATKLQTMPLPQRLYYNQTIFRSGDAHKAASSEIAQCGIELIGAAGKKADVEMVVMAVDALRACGLKEFHIELGHVEFFRTLAAEMEMPPAEIEQMRRLIEGKNFTALKDMLAPYAHRPACTTLERLSGLFGGVEVLEEAEKLSAGSSALAYLRSLYQELEAAGYGRFLRFDLGLVHQIHYYTGVVFRGYVAGAGNAVLSGGRYDALAGAFGRPAQATGFAIDVDAVAGCLPSQPLPRLKVVIHYQDNLLAQALSYLDGMPGGTCELSPCSTLEATQNLAREKGAKTVLVLDETGCREVAV